MKEKHDNSFDLTKISKEEIIELVSSIMQEKNLFAKQVEEAKKILDHARFPKDFKW